MPQRIQDVREYWDTHLNLTQFLDQEGGTLDSEEELFKGIGRTLSRYDYKEPLLERFAENAAGEKLLEIGCGLGVDLARLGELGFDVVGMDLAPRAVEVCGRYLEWKRVNGTAVVGNAESMDFTDESFDVVYSCGVLQHTPDIGKAVSEILRVLRPGGRILIVLYHRHSWLYLLHRFSGTNIEFADEDAPIVNTYTRTELGRLFGEFRDLQVTCEYFRPLPTVRKGGLAMFYNGLFVPVMSVMPSALIRRFGWHLVLTGKK